MINIKTVKQRIAAKHGSTIQIVESTFTGFKKHACFIDIDYGEWKALVYAICRGQRHPERFRVAQQITLEETQHRLKKYHKGLITIKSETFEGASKPAIFIDIDFGEWESILPNVLNGLGHPDRVKKHQSDWRRYTTEKINKLLKEKHSDTVKLVGDYTGMKNKCRFIDIDFGEFEAFPGNVIHKGTGHPKRAILRREQTSLQHYGTCHPMQNDQIFLKQLKSMRKHVRLQHWKTNEEMYCANRWEAKVACWFNERYIDYLWQPKTFKMPNGKTYRPDLYIIDWNKWIEIKGYFRESSRKKWEWFQTIMPNSELWDKSKLKELDIL